MTAQAVQNVKRRSSSVAEGLSAAQERQVEGDYPSCGLREGDAYVPQDRRAGGGGYADGFH